MRVFNDCYPRYQLLSLGVGLAPGTGGAMVLLESLYVTLGVTEVFSHDLNLACYATVIFLWDQ